MLYLHAATKSNVRSMAAVVVVVLVVVVRVLVTRCQHLARELVLYHILPTPK